MSKQDTQTEPLRRHYTATFKRELVERSLQPGASVSGIALENGMCRRRFNTEPPCRLNIEPGMEADVEIVGCG